jgi:hypothetical protein
VKLTKTFSPETYAEALESWSWLPLAGKVPVQATVFGDVFLKDADGLWFLDSVGGTLVSVAPTIEELQSILSTPEGQDNYLMAGLAEAAEREGLLLQASEVFDFTKPPVLGGKLEVDNLVPKDFVVALNIAGQIHDQVRNLPPGTKISNIKIG